MSLRLLQQAATSVDATEEDLENVQAQRSPNRGKGKAKSLSSLLIRIKAERGNGMIARRAKPNRLCRSWNEKRYMSKE
jgi:hypothetical protein